jgi:pimeloyl-ACP methyl ester carboxylesterase
MNKEISAMASNTITSPTPATRAIGTDIRTGTVTSRDGTTIGYLELGRGPSLILLHGAMVSARSFTRLAEALADSHTVVVPDRRGRGLSGPFGGGYSIDKEIEDLDALVTRTGATDFFGVSAGALIGLRAALSHPAMRRLALYEPALSVDGSFVPSSTRMDRELANGDIAAALITGMKETRIGPPIFNVMPRRLLESITNKSMRDEDRKAAPGDVTMRMLAPTLHYDIELIHEMSGTLDDYRAVRASVLLLGGSKSPAWAGVALDALERVLPAVTRVEFPGLDHGGVTNPSTTNRASDPELVAQELSRFFA